MAKYSKKIGEEAEIESSYKSIAGKYSKNKSAAKVKKGKLGIILVSAIVLLAIIGLGIYFYFSDVLNLNRSVEVKTVMAGVDITGMSYSNAVNAVKKATDNTFTQESMVVILGEERVLLTPELSGISFNAEEAVKAACKAKASAGEYFDITPYLNLNETNIKNELTKLIDTVAQPMVPTTFEISGEVPDLTTEEEPQSGKTVTLTVGSPGVNVNLEDIYRKVLAAYNKNTFEVNHSSEISEPTVPDFSEAKAAHSIDPVNAEMDKTTFEISQHKYGYTFSEEEILAALETAQYGQSLQFNFKRVKPEVTKEDLSATLFCDVLGEYTATNPSIPGGRDVNLKLSCEKINNIVLLPGETFDYNKALGERTAAAGWKKADGYMGMETVSEYGGGICQASSSLYYCALIADLEIVTRHCHGFISAYMPPGMDATVSWGGPDFRFKNNMEYPIRIEAEASGGKVTVRLLGTDTKDYYVKMEYEQYNMVWWNTEYVEMTTEEAKAKGYTDGSVICTPYNGSTVQTYKLKYNKETDELISKEKEELSIYNCRNYMICKIVDPENKDDNTTDDPGTGTPTDPTDPTPPSGTDTPTTDPTPDNEGTEPTPTPGTGGDITEG